MSEQGSDGDRIRPARRWSEHSDVPERAASLDDEIRGVAAFARSVRRSRTRLFVRRWGPLVLALVTLVASAAAALSVDLRAKEGLRGTDLSALDLGDPIAQTDGDLSQRDYAPAFDDNKQGRSAAIHRTRWRRPVEARRPRAPGPVTVAAAPVVMPATPEQTTARAARPDRSTSRREAARKKDAEKPARREPPPPPPEPTAPLMHLYKKKTGAHFFTISDEVKARRLKNGWTFVHLEGDCYTEELPGSVALFQDEGIVCFAFDEKTEVTTSAIRRFTDANGDVVLTTNFDAETWSGSWTSDGVVGYVG